MTRGYLTASYHAFLWPMAVVDCSSPVARVIRSLRSTFLFLFFAECIALHPGSPVVAMNSIEPLGSNAVPTKVAVVVEGLSPSSMEVLEVIFGPVTNAGEFASLSGEVEIPTNTVVVFAESAAGASGPSEMEIEDISVCRRDDGDVFENACYTTQMIDVNAKPSVGPHVVPSIDIDKDAAAAMWDLGGD